MSFQNVNSYPEPDPLAGEEKLEFYGQRPWRPGKLSAEPADSMKEVLTIQALQYKEKYTVNHSVRINSFLFKRFFYLKIFIYFYQFHINKNYSNIKLLYFLIYNYYIIFRI